MSDPEGKPVLVPTVHPKDGHPDLLVSDDDAAFIVRAAYEAGVFAMIPLTHIEYVKTGHADEDEKVLSKNLKIPIVGVDE